MKNLKLILLLNLIVLGLGSCGSDTDPIVAEPDLSVVNDDLVVNGVYEDMDNFTLEVLESNGINARFSDAHSSSICETAEITINQEARRIVIDFGTGCTNSSGIVRKGKVILEYTGNFLIPGAKVTTSLDGYEVNGLKVEGTRTITNSAINLISNQITLDVEIRNGKVTWPDNTFVTYSSDQVREVKLGSGGYEISVTGTANGEGRAGYSYTAATSSALLVRQDCVDSGVLLPSSGVINFTYEGIVVSVDYGDGLCDKMITVTYPGGSKEITVD